MSNVELASREIFWNIPAPLNAIIMYALFLPTMVVFLWGIWGRIRLWSAGLPDPEREKWSLERLRLLYRYVALQKKTNRDESARVFHGLILSGFIVLLFTTTMVFVDHDLGIPIYQGRFYLAVTTLSDVFGLLFLLGIGIAFHRRYVQRPDKLHSTSADAFMLSLLALLIVQGFALEGLRIYATSDPWAGYSPVGYLTSLLFWGLGERAVSVLHFGTWWFHTLSVFVFIALIPYTKFLHIISSSANLYFQQIARPKGALRSPGDIDTLMEKALESEAEDFSLGVRGLDHLSWKQRLDLDACTSCGRCQEVCPAYNSGTVLSPQWLILAARTHMLKLAAKGEAQSTAQFFLWKLLDRVDRYLLELLVSSHSSLQAESEKAEERAQNELVQQSALSIGESLEAAFAGEVLDENVFWSCTTCRACMEVCPVGIEHVDFIVDVRRSKALMEGAIPSEAQSSLRAIENRGNPFGPAEDRFNWAEGLEVPVLNAGDSAEILYWVGCISAYDNRKQKIARSMVEILNASGLRWGVLGDRERCTGDPARRLGEENLYQQQAKSNVELLRTVKVDKIVANCPHCFNTIRNEYPEFGSLSESRPPEVIHHTVFITDLLSQGKLTLENGEELSDVTYHDPCYLGRYNDHYDEPREVLVQLGARIEEMPDSREKGLCCGAGGGHFWMDLKVGERVNVQRTKQAKSTNAPTVASGCPFCLHMLEDGVKLTDSEAELQVRDIAELVAERLQN